MSATSLRLLQTIQAGLVIAVTVTCTILLTIGWKGVEVPMWTMRRTAPQQTQTSIPTPQEPSLVPSCSASTLTVLGKPLDRCATSQAMQLAEEEDIYMSVKTASKNHASRMLPVLLTWLQTLQPKQVLNTKKCRGSSFCDWMQWEERSPQQQPLCLPPPCPCLVSQASPHNIMQRVRGWPVRTSPCPNLVGQTSHSGRGSRHLCIMNLSAMGTLYKV